MNCNINSGDCLLDKKTKSINCLFYFIVFFLVIYVLLLHFLALIPIDGESMENTLYDNQYCLVQRNSFKVHRNDIVTINTAADGDEPHIIIKRVIAVEGDMLAFMTDETGKYVDLYICENNSNHFILKSETYIKTRMLKSANVYNNVKILDYIDNISSIDVNDREQISSLLQYIITVPNNSIYFLGDNRNISRDSRYYGTRTLDKITSKFLFAFG